MASRRRGPAGSAVAARAVEGGFHAADRRVDELGDFLERIVEDVLQQDAGPLFRGQSDHEPLYGPIEAPAEGVNGLNQVRHGGARLGLYASAAAAQKIDAMVVRDPKQPRLKRPAVVKGVKFAIGVEQRLLHDVFAVENRAGHAGAVAVQPRAQMRDRLQEIGVPRLKKAERLEADFGQTPAAPSVRHRLDDRVGHLLGVAKQHQRVVAEEELVVDAGVA